MAERLSIEIALCNKRDANLAKESRMEKKEYSLIEELKIIITIVYKVFFKDHP